LTLYLRKVGIPDFFDQRAFELKPHIMSALKFCTKIKVNLWSFGKLDNLNQPN